LTRFGRIVSLLAMLSGLLYSGAALADCVNPNRPEGIIVYNTAYNVPMYCNGTNWVSFGVNNAGAGSGGCSNPTGTEGKILYNSAAHTVQYCDGSVWRGVASGQSRHCGYGHGACPAGSSYTGCLSNYVMGWGALTCTNFGGYTQVEFTLPTVEGLRIGGSDSQAVSLGNGLFCGELGMVYAAQTYTAAVAGPYARGTTTSGGDPWVLTGNTTNGKSDTVTCTAKTCITLGERCSDGTINAGLAEDGNQGFMFATPADAPAATWNNGTSPNTDIGSVNPNCTAGPPSGTGTCYMGETNTTNIFNTGGTYNAALYCHNLTAYGQSDWYLPGQDELYTLYTNRAIIGGFTTGTYWSSSESASTTARAINFSTGTASAVLKNNSNNIRCVRKN